MRKFASIVVLMGITLLALAGCGGDSGCGNLSGGTAGTATGGGSCGTGNPGGGGTTNTTPSSVAVTTTTTNIPADGSSSATITALVANSSGVAVSGTSVTLVASAGTLSASSGTTDSNGKVTVTLAAGGAASGTHITVTATVGTLTGSTTVTVAAASQQAITLATSSPTISSDNSVPVTVTAFVKDANNNFVTGATVDFSATSGGLSVNNGGVTDANGSVTAVLSVAGDPSTRTITVTASANGTSSTINVGVVGTSITLDGPVSLVQGTPGTYTVSLTNSGNKGIASAAITVSSSAGNTLSASSITTDTTGHATFTVTAIKSTADTLTATALGTSTALPVQVSSQQFSFTAPTSGALIPIAGSPCTPNIPVSVSFTNAGAPIADGTTVTFSSTRGTLSSANAMTVGGIATVNICATTAGPATLSAAATPAAPAAPVSATEVVSFISTSPSALNLQASPQTVSINGKSTFTAVVRDAAGNLVQNQEVDFTLTDTTGGQLSVGSAVTDVEGVATTVYTAGTTASAANGVSVLAKLQTNSAVTDTATLTVNGAALHISFGTGQKIRENATSTAFLQDWFVTVVDSSGASVPNQAVTLTLHSASRPHSAYFKGAYQVCGGAWVQYDGVTRGCDVATGKFSLTQPTACLNEDIDLSGVYNAAEDINHDNVLEPGDIAIVTTNPIVTGADGTATFTIEWPEDHSLWVAVDLTATASVAGTESSSTTYFVLPILATYLTTVTSSPPGAVSPYGVGACTSPP